MTSHPCHFATAAAGPVKGAWRPLLRTRLVGRAEPLYVDTHGLRSAASIWSGAQVWAQLLRAHPDITSVVVWQAERLALVQLLVAALWDGRTLEIEAPSDGLRADTWCLDGRQLVRDGQPVCHISDGGWPHLECPDRLSILDMLAVAPAHGDIVVHGQQASHGDLWLALGAPLGHQLSSRANTAPQEPPPAPEVLAQFDLACLATPQDVLNDALVPLLRSTEVWERAALPQTDAAPSND